MEKQDNIFKTLTQRTALGSFFLLAIFVFIIALDQLSKAWWSRGAEFKNYFFVFSIPLPLDLIYFIYGLVFLGMIYYVLKYHQSFSFISRLAWVFIFAGALSNLFERIFLGYVRDFIYISLLHFTGVYNLADGFILLGIVLLIFNSQTV